MYQKILVAVLVAVVLVASAVLVSEFYLKPSSDTSPEPETSTGGSPSLIPTTAVATSRTESGSSGGTSSGGVSPNTVSPSIIPTTAVATTRTVSGPPSFTLLVTPVEARAGPGDTIRYTLSIEPKGGFDQPVALRLDVSALFLYHNSFDLGTVSPPYPTTMEYSFTVPNDVPGGITVKGVLSAEGGGHKEEQDLVLIVGN